MEQNSNKEAFVAVIARAKDGRWEMQLSRADCDGVRFEADFDDFSDTSRLTYTLTPCVTASGTFNSPAEGLLGLTRRINATIQASEEARQAQRDAEAEQLAQAKLRRDAKVLAAWYDHYGYAPASQNTLESVARVKGPTLHKAVEWAADVLQFRRAFVEATGSDCLPSANLNDIGEDTKVLTKWAGIRDSIKEAL